MTDAGWAERMVKFLESVMPLPVHKRRDALLKLSALLGAIREAEHARSVRIVKQYLKRYGTEGSPCELICNDLLAALQRGRGGEG